MIAYERRASTVLFNLLACHQLPGPILLPANVCPIVPLTLLKLGRRFEFVDISLSTLAINHDSLIRRWNAKVDRPAGLVYVRTYGATFKTAEIFDEIKRLTPAAIVIDDRCACVPAFDEEVLVKNVDAVLYSTGYSKFVDIGFGGYALVRDGTPYRRVTMPFDEHDLERQTAIYKRSLSNREPFHYVDNGWLEFAPPKAEWHPYRRMVEAATDRTSELKQSINHIYSSRLPKGIQLKPTFQSWRFNIHVADKSALLLAIRGAGLFASSHYHSLPGLFGAGTGESANMLHRHVVNLFNDRYFDTVRAVLLSNLICESQDLAPSHLDL